MADLPEPCLEERCWSPVACGAFGYCRERNMRGITPTTTIVERWRRVAAQRKGAQSHDR